MGEIDILLARMAGLEARVSLLETRGPQAAGGRVNGAASSGRLQTGPRESGESKIATDRDLDGDYGDPVIKFDPREKYWSGPSYVGCKFSECPAEYLDAMVRYLEACVYASRADAAKGGPAADEKKNSYKEKDAARARGWAKRIREGKVAPPRPEPTPQVSVSRAADAGFDDYAGSQQFDEIPF